MTYTIDGKNLQGRIMSTIELLQCDYDELRFTDKGTGNYIHCYANYIADIEVLRELLSLQGLRNVENQMVIEYIKDLCY